MMDNGFLRDVLEGWMLGQENKSQKNTGTITLKRRLISKEELQRFEESSWKHERLENNKKRLS